MLFKEKKKSLFLITTVDDLQDLALKANARKKGSFLH